MLQQNLPGITNEYGLYGHLSSAIYFQGVYPMAQATAPWIAPLKRKLLSSRKKISSNKYNGLNTIPRPWLSHPFAKCACTKVFFFLVSAVSPNECSSTALDLLKVVGKKRTYSPNGGETWCIITGQIPQNYHIFVLFDPPQNGSHLMTPETNQIPKITCQSLIDDLQGLAKQHNM